jgi:endonuclease I
MPRLSILATVAVVLLACPTPNQLADAVNLCESTDKYYADYISSFTSKAGTDLRDILRSRLAEPYKTIKYSSSSYDAKDALATLDARNDCCVTELYTRASSPKSSKDWNREHVWPNSRGLYGSGQDYSDIHNLRAADLDVNNDRANKIFGDCPGCAVGSPEAPLTRANGEVWEPPAEMKGDIARAMFYMYTRYSHLKLTDNVLGPYEMGKLSDLLKWHEQDPVSDAERRRNNGACVIQQNRNPFVDYPCLVGQIFGRGVAACSTTTLPGVPTQPPMPSATGGPTFPSEGEKQVLISQYMEGSGENRALQLRNVGEFAADLNQYAIRVFFNGKTTSGQVIQFPQRTILDVGESYTICHSTLQGRKIYCDMYTGSLVMNGDDALALTSSTNAANVYDTIGEVGVRPNGGGFTVCTSPTGTADQTLVRQASIKYGNKGIWNGNNACRDWTIHPQNAWISSVFRSADETDDGFVVEVLSSSEQVALGPEVWVGIAIGATSLIAATVLVVVRRRKRWSTLVDTTRDVTPMKSGFIDL